MASLASNGIITVWMYFELFVRKTPERLSLKGFRPDMAVIRTLLRIGLPAMLSSLMIYVGFYLINNEVEKIRADRAERTGYRQQHHQRLLHAAGPRSGRR